MSGELVVDISKRRLTLAGRELSLMPTEYTLLKTRALSAGKVHTHHNLLREAWGPRYADDPNLLRVNRATCATKIESTRPVPITSSRSRV